MQAFHAVTVIVVLFPGSSIVYVPSSVLDVATKDGLTVDVPTTITHVPTAPPPAPQAMDIPGTEYVTPMTLELSDGQYIKLGVSVWFWEIV
jgi:hypothetical protein